MEKQQKQQIVRPQGPKNNLPYIAKKAPASREVYGSRREDRRLFSSISGEDTVSL